MKRLTLICLTFNFIAFGQATNHKDVIQESETISGLISGVEKEYGVNCEEINDAKIKFYKKKVNKNYSQNRYELKVSCDVDSESSVFITIDGISSKNYQLVEKINIGFAG